MFRTLTDLKSNGVCPIATIYSLGQAICVLGGWVGTW